MYGVQSKVRAVWWYWIRTMVSGFNQGFWMRCTNTYKKYPSIVEEANSDSELQITHDPCLPLC
ncbi:unnamed protein product [Fusarium venenatum]|uniref:Uncharacterized protein n=1 Tax=Fusarium venenatum TaxID=56646 RepID=A0A2L2T873_9HYPO|nr:uncharacterized protein FVRRES_03594 [Fusarium venenatum]CEI67082.1 unnamed protein product [Fusarium venenatum]